MTRNSARLIMTALLGPVALVAQDRTAEPTMTRTFELNRINSKDAAQLIGPYAMSGQGAVFEAGSIRAVTVQGPASLIRTADSLLKIFDGQSAMVTLRFTLLAPSDRPGSMTGLQGVEQELKEIFGTSGHRVVGQATARVGEHNSFTVIMNAEGGHINLSGSLGRLMKGSGEPSIGLTLSARSMLQPVASDTANLQMGGLAELFNSREFIDTGMIIPIGHTLILGAGGSADADALVLIVKPEI